MTPDDLTKRITQLLLVLGEPAGTVVVTTRPDDAHGWVACVMRPEPPETAKAHPLDVSACGATEDDACDAAWSQMCRHVGDYVTAAGQRVERAEAADEAAQRELAEARLALSRAGALRLATMG